MWDFPVYSVAPPALHLGVENARGSLPSLGSGPPTRAHYSGHRSRAAAWYLCAQSPVPLALAGVGVVLSTQGVLQGPEC